MNAQDFLEDEQLVTQIQGTDNPYYILQVPRDATDNDIRAKHKELVLRLHPDRHRDYFARHPAREREFAAAFQKVHEAKDFLLNPRRRNKFDGNSNVTFNAREAEFESEAEFEHPFGADNANERDNNDPWNNNPAWWETKTGYYCLVFLSVILLLLIPAHIYTSPSLAPSDPIFRFERDIGYRIRKRTLAGKITYFVTENFEAEFNLYYQGSRSKLESDVKTAYKTLLSRKCYRENNKDYYLEMARISGNRKMYLEATSPGTPACDELERLFGTSNQSIFAKLVSKIVEYIP